MPRLNGLINRDRLIAYPRGLFKIGGVLDADRLAQRLRELGVKPDEE